MSSIDATIILKTSAVIVASVPAANYIVPMWGIGPASFVLGGVGAVMSYVWEIGEKKGKVRDTALVLIVKSLLVTLFSVALVVVVPDLFDWDLLPRSEPPLTFIVALYGRHIYPALQNAIPNIVRGLGNALGSRSGGEGGSYYSPPDQEFPQNPGPAGPRERDCNGRDEPPTGGY